MAHMLIKAMLFGLLCSLGTVASASEADFDLDSRIRAKLAKEKIKQSALERKNNDLIDGANKGECGSQNIGNVDTGGKPGTAPREIFVFAPNAINFVSGRGCK